LALARLAFLLPITDEGSYSVTVFDRMEEAGGLLIYGILPTGSQAVVRSN